MTRAVPFGVSRRARQAFLALLVVAGVTLSGYGAAPALAGQPLTYDHMAGRPRHYAPESVARDTSGNILVADANQMTATTDDRIAKYDADGTFLDVIAGPGTAAGSVTNPMGIAIAPTAGHDVYVVENGSAVSGGIDRVSYFSSLGNYLGSWGTTGSGNGSFNDPHGIAIDSTGAVYVADYGNNRVQVFDTSGTWSASWNGITHPTGIAVDGSDRIWVASGAATVSRYGSTGAVQASWASSGATGIDVDTDDDVWVSSTSGLREYGASGTLLATMGSGEVTSPHGLATAPNAVYVADTGNGRVARFALPPASTSWSVPAVTGLATDGTNLFTADGADVNTYSLSGAAGTTWASNDARSTAVDASGNVWVSSVADGVVREYDPAGSLLATVGSGTLSSPRGIAVASGKLYVADTGNNRIVKFTTATGLVDTQWNVTGGVTGVAVSGSIVYAASPNTVRPYTTNGVAQTTWASSGATDLTVDPSGNIWVSSSDGVVREYTSTRTLIATVGSGVLSTTPTAVAFANGRLYVADTGNDQVVRFSFASFDTAWGQYPGDGVEDAPAGISVDSSNNVYVTNSNEDSIQKFDANGDFVTDWGQQGTGNGDLANPGAIAVAPSGLVYVADSGNDRIQVFDQNGVYQSQWGSYGTNASLRQMDAPSGLAIDASGNVYVADLGNDRITKFTAAGTYVTTWGLLGTGDGQFNDPRGLAIDGGGNVWVADSKNNRIQGFTSTGAFVTKWGGSGVNGVSTGTAPGKFNKPFDLDVDAEGSLWVVDSSNNRIQRMTTAGVYLSSLGSLGLDVAEFSSPSGIAIDGAGMVSVADTKNNRVQVFVDLNGPDTSVTGGPGTETSLTTATFTFTANEPGATFECTIDGGGSGPWNPCSSGDQYNSISEGAHTFYVRATDAASNLGDTATYDWSVDLTPPTVSIDTAPSSPTKSTDADFDYHSSEGGSTFLCSVDGASAVPCGSSYSAAVTSGDHTFEVWAVDPAGNQSSNPAQASWTVDTTPPVVHITDGPNGWVQSANATFTFDSPDAGATFECHMDGAAYAPCTSPASYSGLSGGLHTFYVHGIDALGNVSADKTQAWTVDLANHKPDAWIGYGGKYAGNDVYNSTALNQSKTGKISAGGTLIFTIRVENDGSATDSFLVQGGGSAKGYTVTYLVGTADNTAKVVNGNLTLSVPAGSYRTISMRVKVGSAGKASWSSLIEVKAEHQPSKVDAVKGIVKRV